MRKNTIWTMIVHCDNCTSLVMAWEYFCSWCGKEKVTFAWQPAPMSSALFASREKRRKARETAAVEDFLHCDSCYSLTMRPNDRFCGVCGKETSLFSWDAVSIDSGEFKRRETLRKQREGLL